MTNEEAHQVARAVEGSVEPCPTLNWHVVAPFRWSDGSSIHFHNVVEYQAWVELQKEKEMK